MATREEILTELQNRRLQEKQKTVDSAGPIKSSTIVDLLNPANKGLSAIADVMRMLGSETTEQVVKNPTNFGRDVPNELIRGPAASIDAMGRGLSEGFFMGLGDEAAAIPYAAFSPRSYSEVAAEFENYTDKAREAAPQSFSMAERIGELIGIPGSTGEKVLSTVGKTLRLGGRLVGDLELGGRKLGERFNRLLPKVRSIDDAYEAAAAKIRQTGELKDSIVTKYDNVKAVSLPGGKNGMGLDDLESLADDYIKAGDKAAGEDILKIAVKVENKEPLTVSDAFKLKTYLNHEAYLPSGKLRTTKSTKVVASWAEDLRKSGIDAISDQNDKLRVLEADKNMSELYELRGKIETAEKRPISVSLSGLAKATVGRPSVFNRLQNIGQSLIDTPANVGARTATPIAGQVFETKGPPAPTKGNEE